MYVAALYLFTAQRKEVSNTTSARDLEDFTSVVYGYPVCQLCFVLNKPIKIQFHKE